MPDVPRANTSQNGIILDPATIIEQGTFWTLALNRNQNLLGKVMLLANRPVEEVTALTLDEWFALHIQIRRATTALIKAFQPDHFNYAFLQNQDRQVHLHIIPRYATSRMFEVLTFDDPDYPSHYAVPAPTRHLGAAQAQALGNLLHALLPPLPAGERG
ncbi:MAG TPA: hypothetical protein VFW76_07700 [Ktedonobacterales bacterium]|nr:hypothetical protein [Ktedonobacterales bacterium]